MPQKVEVLLRENLKNLGKCGDVVRVPPGYARNYLLPRKLATEASDEQKRLIAGTVRQRDVQGRPVAGLEAGLVDLAALGV